MLLATAALVAWRNAIIAGITIALVPTEIVFSAIEAELERRGVVL